MDLNKVMIIGRLTRDPEVRTTPQGATVCNFSVATNLMWTDAQGQKQKKVEYHNIVTWRKLADICSQYLKKGMQVYVEGRLQTREWQAQDGAKRQRTEIVADNMIMLGSPSGRSSYQSGGFSSATPAKPVPTAPAPTADNVPIIDVSEPVTPLSPPQATPTPSVSAPATSSEEKKDEVRVEDIPF